jgi:hypothetical protein
MRSAECLNSNLDSLAILQMSHRHRSFGGFSKVLFANG